MASIVVACKPKKTTETPVDDDTTLAEDGTDTIDAESETEILTGSLVSSSTSGGLGLASATDLVAGDVQSQTVGDGAKALFFPRGCLTVTLAPGSTEAAGTITYDFANCAGPAGLVKLTGQVKATYKATASSLTLDLVGTDLAVQRATVDWTAHAEIVAEGASRQMTWRAQLVGTTARGREFQRSNEKIAKWRIGEPCFAFAGKSEGNVKGRTLRVEVTDFSRCRGSCPAAGGKITITNVDKNLKVEITFDGSARATLVGPKGDSTTFPLYCRAI